MSQVARLFHSGWERQWLRGKTREAGGGFAIGHNNSTGSGQQANEIYKEKQELGGGGAEDNSCLQLGAHRKVSKRLNFCLWNKIQTHPSHLHPRHLLCDMTSKLNGSWHHRYRCGHRRNISRTQVDSRGQEHQKRRPDKLPLFTFHCLVKAA